MLRPPRPKNGHWMTLLNDVFSLYSCSSIGTTAVAPHYISVVSAGAYYWGFFPPLVAPPAHAHPHDHLRTTACIHPRSRFQRSRSRSSEAPSSYPARPRDLTPRERRDRRSDRSKETRREHRRCAHHSSRAAFQPVRGINSARLIVSTHNQTNRAEGCINGGRAIRSSLLQMCSASTATRAHGAHSLRGYACEVCMHV